MREWMILGVEDEFAADPRRDLDLYRARTEALRPGGESVLTTSGKQATPEDLDREARRAKGSIQVGDEVWRVFGV